MSSADKAKDVEVMKFLNKKDFKVKLIDKNKLDKLEVVFHGPKESPYKDGAWRIHVHIPSNYPNKPPHVFFKDPMFHPNISETGRICLDVLSEGAWKETYKLGHIFEYFLPQLLCCPNPRDRYPYNSDAAKLLNRNKERFGRKVREHIVQSMRRRKDVTGSSSGANKKRGRGRRSSQHQSP